MEWTKPLVGVQHTKSQNGKWWGTVTKYSATFVTASFSKAYSINPTEEQLFRGENALEEAKQWVEKKLAQYAY